MCSLGKRISDLAVVLLTVCLFWLLNFYALVDAQWVPQVLPVELQVGYAVRTLDLSGDGKIHFHLKPAACFCLAAAEKPRGLRDRKSVV